MSRAGSTQTNAVSAVGDWHLLKTTMTSCHDMGSECSQAWQDLQLCKDRKGLLGTGAIAMEGRQGT